MTERVRKPWGGALVGLLLLGGVWAVFWSITPIWQQQNLNDDSYITLTYAKNLARGDGFVYNHPPATLGTTTPLFTLVTALIARLTPGMDVADVAIGLSLVAWLAAAWVLYRIMRLVGLAPTEAMLPSVVLLWMVRPWLFYIGMEIWLFQLLLLLSIYFWLAERPLAAGLCVGALTLTRGEGVLMGGIIGAHYLWRDRRALPWFLAGGALMALAWIGYAWPRFGTVIPNTLAAKQAQAELPTANTFLQRIAVDFAAYVNSLRVGTPWLNTIWFWLPLGIAALARWRALWIFVVWIVAYVVAYALLDPNPYAWYVLHLIFVLHILCGVGLAYLVLIVRQMQQPVRRAGLAAVAVLLCVGLLRTDITFLLQDARSFAGDARAPIYRELTDWLSTHTDPTESVAYIEVGYLGYFTDNRIVDLAGLTDPTITPHLTSDGYAWGFRHYDPDYYIHNPLFDWALADLQAELTAYEPVYTIDQGAGQPALSVLRRASDDSTLSLSQEYYSTD